MCVCVCGCVDGSWEADTVQENHPLATDLFSRWQFQSNSHPASQWLWPPNIFITSSSTGLPQPVTQEREGYIHPSQFIHAYTHSRVLCFFCSFFLIPTLQVQNIPHTPVWVCDQLFPCSWGRRRDERRIDFGESQRTLGAINKPPDTLNPLFPVFGGYF